MRLLEPMIPENPAGGGYAKPLSPSNSHSIAAPFDTHTAGNTCSGTSRLLRSWQRSRRGWAVTDARLGLLGR
jgi:hypothetical protein